MKKMTITIEEKDGNIKGKIETQGKIKRTIDVLPGQLSIEDFEKYSNNDTEQLFELVREEVENVLKVYAEGK